MLNDVVGVALSRYDWCPYEKKGLGHRHPQRQDCVKTEGEEGAYKQHLDFGLLAWISVGLATQSVVHYGSSGKATELMPQALSASHIPELQT